jgi:S-adenosylmethionine decarboxylase
VKLFVALALFEGCPSGWLDSAASQRAALEAAVRAGGFQLFQLVVQPFEPQGVTACAVVGESHLAIHTWPEEGRLFLDVASCSTRESVDRAVEAIARALPSGALTSVRHHVVEPPPRPGDDRG